LADVADWTAVWETWGPAIIGSVIGGLIVVAVVALWPKRNKVRRWFTRKKPGPIAVVWKPLRTDGEYRQSTQKVDYDYTPEVSARATAKKEKEDKDAKPYKKVEGYARHKGSHIKYRARVAKDDPSQFTITWVGKEPLCTVCKIPLVRKKRRDMNPRMVCPDCGKVHFAPFKADLSQHWVRSHIEDDLVEKGHIVRP